MLARHATSICARCVSESSRQRGRMNHQVDQGRGLVPAWEVVVLGNFVEAETQVDRRHGELGSIDHPALEGRVDVGRGQQLRRDAELLDRKGTQSQEPHLEAFEIVDRGDLLAKPAGSLRCLERAEHGVDVVAGQDLAPQLLPAAVIDPGEVFARRGSKRHRREQGGRTDLTGPEGRRRPSGFDRPLGDGIEHLERRHQRTRLVEFDDEIPARDCGDLLGEALCSRAEDHHRTRHRARHLPAHRLLGCGWAGNDDNGDRYTDPGPRMHESNFLKSHLRSPLLRPLANAEPAKDAVKAPRASLRQARLTQALRQARERIAASLSGRRCEIRRLKEFGLHPQRLGYFRPWPPPSGPAGRRQLQDQWRA